MRVLMLFLDGVGIGKPEPAVNPFFAARLPALRSLFNDEILSLQNQVLEGKRATLVPLDATLGIDGLPQSGTGQTALFTGVNGAKIVGKHFGPYPYSTLKPIVEQQNIFRQLLDAGKSVCFANAFPQRFFDYVKTHRSRLTVTTLSCMTNGIPLLRAEDLAAGKGISADITNVGWGRLGYPEMSVINPAEAGRRLARLSSAYDFVLFEYWKTDHAGHSQDISEAIAVLECFDGMLGGVLEELDLNNTLLFITSDHGNIEDISTKVHTRNPVPAILCGSRHREFASRLRSATSHPRSLTLVTPLLVEALLSVQQHQLNRAQPG